MFSAVLMDNKVENVDLMAVESGVTDQTESVPAVDAGEGETKTSDPSQAEPTPGDRSEQVDDDSTDGIKGGELSWNRG